MRILLLLCSLAGCRAGGAAAPRPTDRLTLGWSTAGLSPDYRHTMVMLEGDGHLAVQTSGMDLLGADGNMLPRTGETWLDPEETAALFRRYIAAGGMTLHDDPPPPDAPGMGVEAVIGRDSVRAALRRGAAPAIEALAEELARRVTVSADSPPVVWSSATASRDCAPWDGVATSVFLSPAPVSDPQAPRALLHLSVYRDMASVAGARWVVDGMKQDAAQASWCPAGGDCVLATTGWIEFSARAGDEPLAGRYDLTLSDGRRIAGRFSATVTPNPALCG
jgi:hypothetical protein